MIAVHRSRVVAVGSPVGVTVGVVSQTPMPISLALVRPPAMHAFLPELQPQLPLHSSAHRIDSQGPADGAAVGAAVKQRPIVSSDAVVRPPVLHVLACLLQPQAPVQARAHVIDAHGVPDTGADVGVAPSEQRPIASSDAVVRPPNLHVLACLLQPQAPVQARAHVIDAHGVPDTGADVGVAPSEQRPIASSDAVVRPPNLHVLACLLQPQAPVQSRAHVIDAHVKAGLGAVVGAAVTKVEVGVGDGARVVGAGVSDGVGWEVVGAGVGDAVGSEVIGDGVGLEVVGAGVRIIVGGMVGVEVVGSEVGVAVGSVVGVAVGLAAGLAVGLAVGFGVAGAAVREQVTLQHVEAQVSM